MAHNCLADFLEELERAGQLARVTADVDPSLELAEITRRVALAGGPAILFQRVRGASMAVVTNLLGSRQRVCQSLAIDSLASIATRAAALIEEHTPQNWFDRLKMTPAETGAEKFRPKVAKAGACQQVVRLGRDLDLAALPLVKPWPRESFASLSAGRLTTQVRGGEVRTVTLCTAQAIDVNNLAVIDRQGEQFRRHWTEWRAAGERMPVAIVLGGDPAATVVASLEVGGDVDVYHLTGLLRGRPLELVKCRTHDLEVPADADVVIEGYLDPQTPPVEIESAAPGGSYYHAPSPRPVVHVTAITHRTHAIVPQWIDSGPAGETAALAAARERVLLDTLRSVAPDVVDLALPCYGGADRYAFVAMRKTYPFHARQVASALWGSAALKAVRFLILVDAGVNVHDTERVLGEVGAHVAPERDVFMVDGPARDDAGEATGLTRHLGIDATSKITGERPTASPPALAAGQEIIERVTARWPEYKLP